LIKVLYFSPRAHRAGHYSYATSVETNMLSSIAQVIIVCYDDALFNIPKNARVLKVRRPILVRAASKIWNSLSLFLEDVYLYALISVWSLQEQYDVVHVRDADPFVFMAFVGALLSRNKNWAMSFVSTWRARSPGFSRLMSSRIWKPLYFLVLRNKNVVMHCQNNQLLRFLSTEFCGGTLSRRAVVVPVFIPEEAPNTVTKSDARKALELPLEGLIFLSIGAVHRGKLLHPLLGAASENDSWWIVHKGALMPGTHFTLADHPKLIFRPQYFTQFEEALYYAASDAVILSYRADFVETASTLWRAVKYRVPVIASDSVSIGNLVRQYQLGLVFKPGDSASLRKAMEKFAAMTEEQRRVFVEGMERFARDFSEESMRKLWLRLYYRAFGLNGLGNR
jgi:glycosyltransferase involved in cell wall biosynthesis